MATLRIGIYGGTFNPVHHAHLRVAKTVLDALALTNVIFVPAGIPPFKESQQLIDAQQRMAMVRLAIADEPRFSLCDFEVQRDQQKSFTIDTVRFLIDQHPKNSEFFFIVGDDCANKLHHWKGIDELSQRVQFVCVDRVGTQALAGAPPLLHIEMPRMAISSTLLRERLLAGESAHDLCPDAVAVADYIEQHQLYRAAVPGPLQAIRHD